MLFTHPEAMWLATAAGVPVVLHLLARARARPLIFPGTYLLRQMEAQRRALRLRHILLLILRVLGLLIAAVACAGPWTRHSLPLVAERPEMLIVLDASASMRSQESAWRRAIWAAKKLCVLSEPGRAEVVEVPDERLIGGDNDRHSGRGDVFTGVVQSLSAWRPSWAQGAVADEVQRLATKKGTGQRSACVFVLTDLEASSALRRKWPPEAVEGDTTIVDCGAEGELTGAIYGARLSPPDPPAGALVRVAAYVMGEKKKVVRAQAGHGLVAAREAEVGDYVVWLPIGKLPPGEREVQVATDGSQWTVAAHVRECVGVWVEGPEPARHYLEAAVDPEGTGKPLRLAHSPNEAAVVVGVGGSAPAARVSEARNRHSLLLFGPSNEYVRQWLAPLLGNEPVGLSVGLVEKLPTDRAERIGVVTNSPPCLAEPLGELKAALDECKVFRKTPLHASEAWQVVARFSDGSPAMLLRQIGDRQIMVTGFSPEPEATDLVTTGVFPVLLHVLVLRLAPPATNVPEALAIGAGRWRELVRGAIPLEPTAALTPDHRIICATPPPAEMGSPRLSVQEVQRFSGAGAKVIKAEDVGPHVAAPYASDLTPLGVLLLVVVAASEWVLAASMSAPAEERTVSAR
jgi:hypothetical protein